MQSNYPLNTRTSSQSSCVLFTSSIFSLHFFLTTAQIISPSILVSKISTIRGIKASPSTSLRIQPATSEVSNSKKGWVVLIIGLIGDFLTNWSGGFLLLGVSLILSNFHPTEEIHISKLIRNFTRRVLGLWVLGIGFVILHFVLIYWTTGSVGGGGFLDALRQRMASGGTAALTPFGPLEFLSRLRLWFFILFTGSLTIVSVIGFLLMFSPVGNPFGYPTGVLNRLNITLAKRVLLALLIFGLGYPLILPNATYIHNYFVFGMIPFLTILASMGVYKLVKGKNVYFAILLVLILAVWFERANFVNALKVSASDKLAYEIGIAIKGKVSFRDLVLVEPKNYAASRLPQLSFYSDRRITFDSNSGYNYIVNVNETHGSYQILPREK